MIKKILVALDGSEPSNRALDLALDLAEKYSAKLELVSVIHEVKMTLPSSPSTVIVDYLKEIRNVHSKILSESLKRAKENKPNLKVSTKLIEGHPADTIIKVAEEGKFDLIIMGARGSGGIKRLFLGSISNEVVNHSKTSVLIVK